MELLRQQSQIQLISIFFSLQREMNGMLNHVSVEKHYASSMEKLPLTLVYWKYLVLLALGSFYC